MLVESLIFVLLITGVVIVLVVLVVLLLINIEELESKGNSTVSFFLLSTIVL